ncbi:MAG: hypothetical protein F6K00_32970 [Leptolyngbya sp. SIOISBB]|nr:hypothetical protein [Leptolyngbya sp. SIOISBB]
MRRGVCNHGIPTIRDGDRLMTNRDRRARKNRVDIAARENVPKLGEQHARNNS